MKDVYRSTLLRRTFVLLSGKRKSVRARATKVATEVRAPLYFFSFFIFLIFEFGIFQDSDLLLSCGKDNKILGWNPNTDQPGGEVVCELATSSQWNYEVLWCPRNPGVLASSSSDGKIAVYSVMGGQQQQQVKNM